MARARNSETVKTWIYLIKDSTTGYFKIGQSINPKDRLKDIKRQSVLLPHEHQFFILQAWFTASSTERALHREFSHRRVRGEWFNLTALDLVWIFDHLTDFDTLHHEDIHPDEFINVWRPEEPDEWYMDEVAGDSEICEAAVNANLLDFAMEAFGYEF